MNRTARIITMAAPLATVAFSLGVSPALAEPAGPAFDQLSSAQQGPVNPHLPEAADDKAPPPIDPDPEPDPELNPDLPDLPDDKVAIPDPCPTHGPCDKDPGDEDEKDPGDDDSSTGDEIDKPTRIDAGTATSDDPFMDTAWLFAGGALITMTGAAFAVRRRERTS